MFEKEAEEYIKEHTFFDEEFGLPVLDVTSKTEFQDGAEFGYNKANEWFDARTSIPLPKKAEIYRYTLEAISDKGDIVCYDYKDKGWKKLVIDNEKVTYVPVEVEMWCNKPTKESE
jgi:hypothetical protein